MHRKDASESKSYVMSFRWNHEEIDRSSVKKILGSITLNLTKMSEDSKISQATINKLIHQIYEIQLGVERFTIEEAIYHLIPSIASLQDRGYKLADIVAYLSENGVVISDLTLSRYLNKIDRGAWSIRCEDEPPSPSLSEPELNLQVGRIPALEALEYYQVILHHLSNESLEIKSTVLRLVWRISGMGLGYAKDIVDSQNKIVISGVHQIVAEYVKYKLQKAGGIASIEKTDDLGDIPRNERFLPELIDEIEFYEVLTLDQKQEFKNRCIFASKRRKRAKKLCHEFLWESRRD